MGTALRAKRLPSVLRVTRRSHRREVKRRGIVSALLVLFFALALSATGQTATGIPTDVAERLRRQIAGSIEEKRAALFEIRNMRSAEASMIALPALRDKNEIVRATASGSVVFMHAADAAAAVLPLIGDKAEFVRREAAAALGEIGYASATAPLIRLMTTDKIQEVRAAAAIALGKIGDVSAVPSLLGVLKQRPREDQEFLRRSTARSIGQIAQIRSSGNPSVVTPQNFLPDKFKDLDSTQPPLTEFAAAVDILVTVVRNSSESDDTRREAAFALGAIGDRRAIPALQASTSSADPYLAEIAREALLKIGQ